MSANERKGLLARAAFVHVFERCPALTETLLGTTPGGRAL